MVNYLVNTFFQVVTKMCFQADVLLRRGLQWENFFTGPAYLFLKFLAESLEYYKKHYFNCEVFLWFQFNFSSSNSLTHPYKEYLEQITEKKKKKKKYIICIIPICKEEDRFLIVP